MIAEEIAKRGLPKLLPAGISAGDWPRRRRELVELLAREEYGVTPPAPADVRAETIHEDPRAWAGKAVHRSVRLGFDTPRGAFSFPVDLVLPIADRPAPVLVHISFTKYPGGEYSPVEEIVDGGYGLAMFCYNDVTEDVDDGFSSGLAGMYPRDGGGAEWGKIGMWAFAASRVMDWLQALDGVDADRVAAIGHSRLGKTALWCAAQDERFAAAVSNESGAGGAAISRSKRGETVRNITTVFPHWFCANYTKYSDREDDMPIDQHMLLAAVAPRLVCVASAAEDLWADPESEFLAAAAASPAWELLGHRGLMHADSFPSPGEALHDGRVGYHLRAGTHFLSRYDWGMFLRFLDRHLGR